MDSTTLKKNLQYIGVKGILFDLDSTLIKTHPIFRTYITQVASTIKDFSNSAEDIELIIKAIDDLFDVYRHIHFVDHIPLWEGVLTDMQVKYNLTTDQIEIIRTQAHQIYTTIPEVFDGTFEMLDLLKEAQIPFVLVTHADPNWTEFKLKSAGLDRYFDESNIVICEIRKEKDKDEWQKGVQMIGLDVTEILVVGDNIKADIIASQEIGIPHQLYVKSGWSPDGLPLPDGVEVIADVGHFFEGILEMSKESEKNRELKINPTN